MSSLLEKINQSLGNGNNSEPIEVKLVMDDPKFMPTGGDNRGFLSVGLWIDDSDLPKDQQLPTIPGYKSKYKNIVFRDISIMEKLVKETENAEKGTIKIPSGMKPNADGAYWINRIPSFISAKTE